MGYWGNRVPRFGKMDVLVYEGKNDPIEWLQKCEDFFEEKQTPTDAWVRQATFALQGCAGGWYHNLRRMRDRLNWYEFSEECKIRFGPPMSMNLLGELTRLNQFGILEDYYEKFESLLSRINDVTPEQSIWHFCAGLSSVIRYEVEYVRLTTLYFSMNLAREIELKVSEEGRIRRFGAPPVGGNQTIGGIKNRETTGNIATPRNSTWKPLTAPEMAESRAKGLYFNCDEMFSAGYKCSKLFCIILTDDDEVWAEVIIPEISMNAITCTTSDKTFQVRAVVGNGVAWVLVDSGSTHNFIAAKSAEELQIQVRHQPGLRVTLPNGGKMASNGVSHKLHMTVQGYEFSADFFSIPLEGFDIFLGIHWLKRLGPIL